jgi:hypothetical protein
MTRVGKIAKLPLHIRDTLNTRIRDGETGKTLVEWLNSQDDVKHVLHLEFEDRPINEQNFSDWKAGGYQDWLRHAESSEILEDIIERHDELDWEIDGKDISHCLANWLSTEFVRLAHQLLEEDLDPHKRWEIMRQLLRELSHLRRDEHSAIRANLKREAWERDVKQDEEAREVAGKLAQAQGLFHQMVLEQGRQQLAKEEERKKSSQIKPDQG